MGDFYESLQEALQCAETKMPMIRLTIGTDLRVWQGQALVHLLTAVDIQRRASDEARFIFDQEHNTAGNIIRIT